MFIPTIRIKRTKVETTVWFNETPRTIQDGVALFVDTYQMVHVACYDNETLLFSYYFPITTKTALSQAIALALRGKLPYG